MVSTIFARVSHPVCVSVLFGLSEAAPALDEYPAPESLPSSLWGVAIYRLFRLFRTSLFETKGQTRQGKDAC